MRQIKFNDFKFFADSEKIHDFSMTEFRDFHAFLNKCIYLKILKYIFEI